MDEKPKSPEEQAIEAEYKARVDARSEVIYAEGSRGQARRIAELELNLERAVQQLGAVHSLSTTLSTTSGLVEKVAKDMPMILQGLHKVEHRVMMFWNLVQTFVRFNEHLFDGSYIERFRKEFNVEPGMAITVEGFFTWFTHDRYLLLMSEAQTEVMIEAQQHEKSELLRIVEEQRAGLKAKPMVPLNSLGERLLRKLAEVIEREMPKHLAETLPLRKLVSDIHVELAQVAKEHGLQSVPMTPEEAGYGPKRGDKPEERMAEVRLDTATPKLVDIADNPRLMQALGEEECRRRGLPWPPPEAKPERSTFTETYTIHCERCEFAEGRPVSGEQMYAQGVKEAGLDGVPFRPWELLPTAEKLRYETLAGVFNKDHGLVEDNRTATETVLDFLTVNGDVRHQAADILTTRRTKEVGEHAVRTFVSATMEKRGVEFDLLLESRGPCEWPVIFAYLNPSVQAVAEDATTTPLPPKAPVATEEGGDGC